MLLDHFDFGSFKFTFDEFALFIAFSFRKMLLNSFKYQNTKVLAARDDGSASIFFGVLHKGNHN